MNHLDINKRNFEVNFNEFNKVFKPKLKFVNIIVGETPVITLLDTGASAALLDEKHYHALRAKYPERVTKLLYTDLTTTNDAFNSNRTNIEGWCVMKCTLLGNDGKPSDIPLELPFYVVKKLSFPAFLGSNILDAYDFTLKMSENLGIFHLPNDQVLKFKIFNSVRELLNTVVDGNYAHPTIVIQDDETQAISATIGTEINIVQVSHTSVQTDLIKLEQQVVIQKFTEHIQQAYERGALTCEQKENWLKEILSRTNVFSDIILGKLIDHQAHLELDEGTPWVEIVSYDITQEHEDAVGKIIDNMVDTEVIERSKSNKLSPLLVVLKKDGRLRLCIDARALNRLLRTECYEPPRIGDILLRPTYAKYMSSFDFSQGFLQIELDEPSRELLAFKFQGQVYQYRRLPFGTSVSPSIFIQCVSEILKKAENPQNRYEVTTYVDDVIIQSPTAETHLQRVVAVLDCIEKSGMKLSVKKSEILQENIQFVGYFLGNEILKKDHKKFHWFIPWEERNFYTKSGKAREIPFKIPVKEIQSLIGHTRWYEFFICDYATKMVNFYQAISNLQPGQKTIDWSETLAIDYNEIKNCYSCQFPLYRVDIYNREFQLYVDIVTPKCDNRPHTIRAALFQRDKKTAELKINMLASYVFKKQENRYTYQMKRVFALKCILKRFAFVLIGKTVHIPIEFYEPLNVVTQYGRINKKAGKWITAIQNFNIIPDLKQLTATEWKSLELEPHIPLNPFDVNFYEDIKPLEGTFKNPASVCAFNTVIQVLAHTRPCVKIFSRKIDHNCVKESCTICLLIEVFDRMNTMLPSPIDLVNEHKLTERLPKLSENSCMNEIRKGERSDAVQLLNELLDYLDKECKVFDSVNNKLCRIKNRFVFSCANAHCPTELGSVVQEDKQITLTDIEEDKCFCLEHKLQQYFKTNSVAIKIPETCELCKGSVNETNTVGGTRWVDSLPPMLRIEIVRDKLENEVIVPVNLRFFVLDQVYKYELTALIQFKNTPDNRGHYYMTGKSYNNYREYSDTEKRSVKVEQGDIYVKNVRYCVYEAVAEFSMYPAYKANVYIGAETFEITQDIGNTRFEEMQELEINNSYIEEQEKEERMSTELVKLDGKEEGIGVHYFGLEAPLDLSEAIQNLCHQQDKDKRLYKIKQGVKEGVEKFTSRFYINQTDDTLYQYMKNNPDQGVRVLPDHLVTKTIRYMHNFYGHNGSEKLKLCILWYFWWPNMDRSIRSYIDNCQDCRLYKATNHHPIPEYSKVVRNNDKGSCVSFDYLGPLPMGTGQVQYILVARDLATGYTWSQQTKNSDAEGAIKLLQEVHRFITAHGASWKIIISDNGRQFHSNLWIRQCEELKLIRRYTTTYHPNSNPTERVIRDISTKLRLYLNSPTYTKTPRGHGAWADAIKEVIHMINDTPDKHGVTPYQMWGENPPQEPFKDLIPQVKPSLRALIEKFRTSWIEEDEGEKTIEIIYDGEKRAMVYADGACLRNGREDALGALGVWFNNNHEYNLSTVLKPSTDLTITNNSVELKAIEQALQMCVDKGLRKVRLITDSRIALHKLSMYDKASTNQKGAHQYAEILQKITVLQKETNSEIEWVRGHRFDYGNKQADRLAKKALLLHEGAEIDKLCAESSSESLNDNENRRVDEYLRCRDADENLRDEVNYNKKLQKEPTKYVPGQIVYAVHHSLSNKERKVIKKFNPPYEGPYEIIKLVHPNVYLVQRVKYELPESQYQLINVVNLIPGTKSFTKPRQLDIDEQAEPTTNNVQIQEVVQQNNMETIDEKQNQLRPTRSLRMKEVKTNASTNLPIRNDQDIQTIDENEMPDRMIGLKNVPTHKYEDKIYYRTNRRSVSPTGQLKNERWTMLKNNIKHEAKIQRELMQKIPELKCKLDMVEIPGKNTVDVATLTVQGTEEEILKQLRIRPGVRLDVSFTDQNEYYHFVAAVERMGYDNSKKAMYVYVQLDKPVGWVVGNQQIKVSTVWNPIVEKRQCAAVDRIFKGESRLSDELCDLVCLNKVPTLKSGRNLGTTLDENLNKKQNEVLHYTEQHCISLVVGPPGTGKTHTAIRLVKKWIEENEGPVLIATPSNQNADDYVKALNKLDIRAYRMYSRSLERVIQSNQIPAIHLIEKSKDQDFEDILAEQVDVIVTTCITAGDGRLNDIEFGLVVVDEAARLSHGETLIPISRAKDRVVLIGDDMQLGPILRVKTKDEGIEDSLFVELMNKGIEPTQLNVQYRQLEPLNRFSSSLYAETVETNFMALKESRVTRLPWKNPKIPIAFVNTRNDKAYKQDALRINEREADLIFRHVEFALKCGVEKEDIGIMVPYLNQVGLVRYILEELDIDREIEVSTIDKTQGRDKELIILALTRQNARGNIGFMSDIRRMNLAISRARRGFVVIGNRPTYSRCKIWKDYFDHLEALDPEIFVEGELAWQGRRSQTCN